MAEAVGNIGDQFQAVTLRIAKDTVDCLDHHLDQVDVLPLVEAADVVGLGNLAFMEDQVYRAGMVFHIKPVADILALAVYRKGFTVAYIVDEQRDELLRELVRAVVVRAVCHDGRKAVGLMVGAYEVVGAGLGS